MKIINDRRIRVKVFYGFLIIILFSIFTSSAYANTFSEIKIDFQSMFEEHGSIMLAIDAETGNIVYVNKSAEAFYGLTKEEIMKMNIKDLNMLSPTETEEEYRAAAEGNHNSFIFNHRAANNEIRTVEVSSYPFEHEGKKFLFSIINDITPQVIAEERIKQIRYSSYAIISLFIILLLFTIFKLYKSHVKIMDANEMLTGLIENMPCNIAVYEVKNTGESGRDYINIYRNDSLCLIENFKGKSLLDIRPNIDQSRIIEIYRQVWETGKPGYISAVKYEDDYFNGWYEIHVFKLSNGHIVSIMNDVSRYKQAEQDIKYISLQLELERNKYLSILLSIGDGVITVDKEKRVVMLNEVAEKLTGWTQEEAQGKLFIDVFLLSHENNEPIINPVDEVLEKNKICELSNHAILTSKDGKRYHIEDSAAPIRGEGGDIVGIVLVFRDVTEKKLQREYIKYLSYHDILTGLQNRRYLEEEIKKLDKAENLPISIIMGDLNGLKLTNDAFGHEEGDRLLVTAATIIKNHCRQDDVVARLGGDEFVILLPKTNAEECEEIVRQINKSCTEVLTKKGILSITFGWDVKENEDKRIEEVLKMAEDSMYKRKLNESPSIRAKTIQTVMETLYEKNKREKRHSERVSALCVKIGKTLGLSGKELDSLKTIGLIHDIGKIIVSDNILEKQSSLTPREWEEMKKHAETGYRIISNSNDMADLAEGILGHHERWDGNGYPKGLKGEEIPIMSRIVAVADAYDAMTTERPYKRAKNKYDAIEELKKNVNTQFDPYVVNALIKGVLYNE